MQNETAILAELAGLRAELAAVREARQSGLGGALTRLVARRWPLLLAASLIGFGVTRLRRGAA